MLTIAEVDLPNPVKKRLRENAAFSDNFTEYTKENIAGFSQPVAVTAAVIGPVFISFVYLATDFASMLQIAIAFGLAVSIFLLGGWYVNRESIRSNFLRKTRVRREAKADLRAGVGEFLSLNLRTEPIFYEHEHGVIAMADSGDGHTVYFDIDSLEQDPRWFIYVNGDMHRNTWTWLKLKGSGAITDFSASGNRLARIGDTPYVEAPDAWEAISIALNEPSDGDIINMSLDEVQMTIARLL